MNGGSLLNIAKIMVPKALTVCLEDTTTVSRAVDVMRRHGYTAIPVLDSGGKFLGCINDRDFLRYILTQGHFDVNERETHTVGDIMRRDFCPPISITATEDEVIDAALRQNFVPIVDDRGCLCGIVTRRLIIAELSGRHVPPDGEFSER